MKFSSFLLLICLFFSACSAPEYPEFREMKNVKFKSFSFSNGGSITLKADAIFFNPNPIGANVTEVDLDVYIDDKKVTNIRQDVRAEMNANSAFTLPLDFSVPLKEVYKDLKPSLGNLLKKRKIDYRMDGTLKVGLGSVEIAVPVDFAGEEELRF
ncbi:MAG: LEA14-like dessication related protein [Saprospiraceae bacterium]|jgi:LEA14-like dessication related protein